MASKPNEPVVLVHSTEMTGVQSQPSLQVPHAPPLNPPTRVRYEDDGEKRNSRLQVRWSDWMAGAQRNSSTYQRVAVLLISWQQDDLNVKKEVSNLEEVFSKHYNYRVFQTQLDITLPNRPQVLINYEVASFVKEQDAEDTLLILYYAGHGTPGRSPGQLKLFGQSNEESTEWYNIVWNYTEANLQDTYADVLVIFDCCYAGDLGRAGRSTRSFEYLAATSASSTTPSPGERSFTSALIWALKEFVEEETPRKFTTTELVNKIREGPFFPTNQVPTLMARDPHSVQRIVLAPLPSGEKTGPTVDESPRTVPACLELRFFFDKEPQERELEDLAVALKKLINRGTGSLYKVYFGGLYSLIHDAARRWKNFAQSNHARPVSPISPNSSDSSSPNPTTTPTQAQPGGCVCRTMVPRCACCSNVEPGWHESPGDPKRRRVSQNA